MNWFKKYISKNDSVFIIAEAGINHNGDFEMALEIIREAKKAGADCIKFQTFFYSASESKHSTMPGYFEGRIGFATKKEWYDSIYFNEEQFAELKKYCEDTGIAFLSTACDIEGLKILKKIGAESLKIASADANNDYLLKAVGKTRLPVILSTGMTGIDEIGHGIEVLRENGTEQIALTQCTSQYPTPYSDINLRAMRTLAEKFKLPTGLSDHSVGIEIPIAAAAMGAKIIEKHFTLSRDLPGVDHAASIEPSELKKMVDAIRHVEQALGSGEKTVQPAELDNAANMRRSLMAARNIKAGTILTEDDITAKRPGTGIPPYEIDKFIGKKINKDLKKEDFLDFSIIKNK
jgi:N,N'-diacetyllegionaminate synthase